MELTIEGVVRRINQPQEFASGFRKCEVHIEVKNGEYSDVLPVEFLKDMADEAGTLTIGQQVRMRCNVRGREWDGGEKGWRAFMSLTVWKYEILTETQEMKDQAATIEKLAKDDGFPF
jgi:hypothetical protein